MDEQIPKKHELAFTFDERRKVSTLEFQDRVAIRPPDLTSVEKFYEKVHTVHEYLRAKNFGLIDGEKDDEKEESQEVLKAKEIQKLKNESILSAFTNLNRARYQLDQITRIIDVIQTSGRSLPGKELICQVVQTKSENEFEQGPTEQQLAVLLSLKKEQFSRTDDALSRGYHFVKKTMELNRTFISDLQKLGRYWRIRKVRELHPSMSKRFGDKRLFVADYRLDRTPGPGVAPILMNPDGQIKIVVDVQAKRSGNEHSRSRSRSRVTSDVEMMSDMDEDSSSQLPKTGEERASSKTPASAQHEVHTAIGADECHKALIKLRRALIYGELFKALSQEASTFDGSTSQWIRVLSDMIIVNGCGFQEIVIRFRKGVSSGSWERMTICRDSLPPLVAQKFENRVLREFTRRKLRSLSSSEHGALGPVLSSVAEWKKPQQLPLFRVIILCVHHWRTQEAVKELLSRFITTVNSGDGDNVFAIEEKELHPNIYQARISRNEGFFAEVSLTVWQARSSAKSSEMSHLNEIILELVSKGKQNRWTKTGTKDQTAYQTHRLDSKEQLERLLFSLASLKQSLK